MKQELLKSIFLLAAGGFAWFYCHSADQNDGRAVIPVTTAEYMAADKSSGNLELVDFQEVVAPSKITADDPEAREFLKSIGNQLLESPPFRMEIEIEQRWASQQYRVAANYSQLGQGSGQSKIEFVIVDSGTEVDQPTSLTKICDGRFLYTFFRQGKTQTLEFIDLHRLHQTRLNSGLTEPQNPSGWIAQGGLAGLFRNLSEAFQFQPISALEMDGVSAYQLNGVWREKPLAELLQNLVDQKWIEPNIQWSRLPSQIPHGVSVEVVNVPQFGWVPHRVIFLSAQQDNQTGPRVPMATIRFSEPQAIPIDASDFINIQNDEVEPVDVTHQYVGQVQEFGAARQAARESSTHLR